MKLYEPFKSKAKNKKYSVYVLGGKLIHFGDTRYEQFKVDLVCILIWTTRTPKSVSCITRDSVILLIKIQRGIGPIKFCSKYCLTCYSTYLTSFSASLHTNTMV